MVDFQHRRDRDWRLSTALCDAYVLHYRQALETWIEEECKDLDMAATLVAAGATGPVQQQAREDIDHIRDISHRELVETTTRLQQRMNDVIAMLSNPDSVLDPLDVLLHLEEGAFRLERLARILLRMRQSYEKLMDDEGDEGHAEGAGGLLQ